MQTRNVNVEEQDAKEIHKEDSELEATLIGDCRHKKPLQGEEESEFHDFDYSFSPDSDGEAIDTSENPKAIIFWNGEPSRVGSDARDGNMYPT